MTTPTPDNAPPGTEVVCIKSFSGSARCYQTDEGKLYTIRAHVKGMKDGVPHPGIVFVEILNPTHKPSGVEFNYDPARFRLLNLAGLDALLTVKEPA